MEEQIQTPIEIVEEEKNPFEKKKYRIKWHLIDALLAGIWIFLGSLTVGIPTLETLFVAVVIAGITIITRFRDFWMKEEKDFY